MVFKNSTLRLSCTIHFNFRVCSHSGYRIYATNALSTFTYYQQYHTLQRLLYFSVRGVCYFKGTEWCHVAVAWTCFSQPQFHSPWMPSVGVLQGYARALCFWRGRFVRYHTQRLGFGIFTFTLFDWTYRISWSYGWCTIFSYTWLLEIISSAGALLIPIYFPYFC